MKYPKRSQYKYAKSQYRIRNWPEYEAGPRRRAGFQKMQSTPGGSHPAGNPAASASPHDAVPAIHMPDFSGDAAIGSKQVNNFAG